MLGNPRKRAKSATQAGPDSVEEQNRPLTQEIPADTGPQQKAGEKFGLAPARRGSFRSLKSGAEDGFLLAA